MSSPRHRSILQSPYQRSNSPSPSRNDIEFLSRKIARLQEENHNMDQELQRVKNRLRRAEDFEIKYDVLSKQKAGLQAQMQSKDRLLQEYQSQIKQLEILCADKKNYEITYKAQKDNLLRQIQQWRLKYYQAEQIASKIRAQQQYKMGQKLMSQLQLLKKVFANQQQDYKNKIRMLEINLAQKQTIQKILKDKNEKNSQQKDDQIQRLENCLNKARDEHLAYVEEKNQEIVNVVKKFEDLFTKQVEKLKEKQANNSEKFSVQVEGLRGLIQMKNKQIEQLIKELEDSRNSHLNEKNDLQKQISLLKQKLYERQRQNQLQLYNLKERLIILHHTDTENMKQNFQKLNLNLQQNIRQLQKLIRQKDKQIFQSNQRFQQKQKQLYRQVQQRDKKISQLNENLRYTGQMTAKQIDNLHSSFQKITTQKGLLSTQYQSTFSFLNNQLTKLTHSNQLKNQQIKDLHLQLAECKKNYNDHIKDLEKKWRIQRKERQQERDKERNTREQLEDQFREKEQKWRHKERVLEREKEKEQREKIKLKITIEELEKNVERLTKHVKENEERLKQEMQKNQTSFVETGTLRRELTGELQRQKSQIEAMKKLQLDQVHRQYEIQISRLNNQNQKLQNQLTELKISFDKLEQEYKKIKNTTKNIDRINKQKLVEYQRKMAALNAQISLTQNLYQSFINAKSRVVKKGSQS